MLVESQAAETGPPAWAARPSHELRGICPKRTNALPLLTSCFPIKEHSDRSRKLSWLRLMEAW